MKTNHDAVMRSTTTRADVSASGVDGGVETVDDRERDRRDRVAFSPAFWTTLAETGQASLREVIARLVKMERWAAIEGAVEACVANGALPGTWEDMVRALPPGAAAWERAEPTLTAWATRMAADPEHLRMCLRRCADTPDAPHVGEIARVLRGAGADWEALLENLEALGLDAGSGRAAERLGLVLPPTLSKMPRAGPLLANVRVHEKFVLPRRALLLHALALDGRLTIESRVAAMRMVVGRCRGNALDRCVAELERNFVDPDFHSSILVLYHVAAGVPLTEKLRRQCSTHIFPRVSGSRFDACTVVGLAAQTALDHATLLRSALAAGCAPDVPADIAGRSPLQLALANQHWAAVDLLLDAGADPARVPARQGQGSSPSPLAFAKQTAGMVSADTAAEYAAAIDKMQAIVAWRAACATLSPDAAHALVDASARSMSP